MDTLSCSSSYNESDESSDDVEGARVQSDARSRLSMLEKRRDDPKEIFDTLINVCPGLKGMNPLPSRGNAITNAADYIKYWSKYFDLSEEGLKDFQENSKNMNDFCEDMENVKMTEPCRQMKEIEKKHTQFAMFTQEQDIPAKLREGLDMDEMMDSENVAGGQLDDGDVDFGEDGDGGNTNENDEEDNLVEYFDIGAEEEIY